MAKTPSYSQKELSYAASQVKREILNKIKKGTMTSVSKTYAYRCVSKKLLLKSSRTLWNGKTAEYLDNWFISLTNSVNEILSTKDTDNKNKDIQKINLTIENLSDIKDELNSSLLLIKEYEAAIKVLREENQELRLKLINKYEDIDL